MSWALASGRPVIGTNIPAFRELNSELEVLQLVTPSAAHELARAITLLDEDEETAKRLVTNASALARKNSWPEVARAHIDLYSSCAPRRR